MQYLFSNFFKNYLQENHLGFFFLNANSGRQVQTQSIYLSGGPETLHFNKFLRRLLPMLRFENCS